MASAMPVYSMTVAEEAIDGLYNPFLVQEVELVFGWADVDVHTMVVDLKTEIDRGGG